MVTVDVVSPETTTVVTLVGMLRTAVTVRCFRGTGLLWGVLVLSRPAVWSKGQSAWG